MKAQMIPILKVFQPAVIGVLFDVQVLNIWLDV